MAEVTFDHETFALLPARALAQKQAERSGGEAEKTPTAATFETVEAASEEVESGTESTGEESAALKPTVPQSRTLQWRGQLPKDKWNLLSHRLLNKLAADQVKIEISINATVTDATVKQQLNTALRELGLIGEFAEQGGES